MSTVPKGMASEAASKEQTNQNAGRSATSAKKLPGPAKGVQGNKSNPLKGSKG